MRRSKPRPRRWAVSMSPSPAPASRHRASSSAATDRSSAAFQRVLAINTTGTFHLDRAAANRMQHNAPGEDGERGVLIHTASVAAYEGQIGQVAYATSKAAVVGMVLPL